jgi:hypothetical protein
VNKHAREYEIIFFVNLFYVKNYIPHKKTLQLSFGIPKRKKEKSKKEREKNSNVNVLEAPRTPNCPLFLSHTFYRVCHGFRLTN